MFHTNVTEVVIASEGGALKLRARNCQFHYVPKLFDRNRDHGIFVYFVATICICINQRILFQIPLNQNEFPKGMTLKKFQVI